MVFIARRAALEMRAHAGNRPAGVGELEIDAYDAVQTIYLLARPTPNGSIAASARLLPTTQPHLMSDLFPHLCQEELPAGATVWEASRFCTAPGTSRRERLPLLWQIFCGIMETEVVPPFDTAR